MRKFIVVRGHAGSGKTTFAKEKIKEFKNEYPQAQIYHLENDMFLTDEVGGLYLVAEAFGGREAQGRPRDKAGV